MLKFLKIEFYDILNEILYFKNYSSFSQKILYKNILQYYIIYKKNYLMFIDWIRMLPIT